MTLLALWVYIGGVAALENQKIGFFKRVFWPLALGERLAAWAWGEGNEA
jgi:hypothetical protein